MKKTVKVTYNADTLQTEIIVDGQPFDTSRINGKEIADWAYPFMMRKIKWNGFYDEMVEALGGEKAFDLVFKGSEEALAELKEAWEDAPVTIIDNEKGDKVVIIEYDADKLSTKITVNGQPFDTSRIEGREIEDWVYPFMMRKVKWDGIFEELAKVVGSEEYSIEFSGSDAAMKELMEECPETVKILTKGILNTQDTLTLDELNRNEDDDIEINDKNLLYAISGFINSDTLNKMSDFLHKFYSAKEENYNVLFKFVNDFNELIKNFKYADDDENESELEKAAEKFVSTLSSCFKCDGNMVTISLKWFCKIIGEIINTNDKNFQNIMPYLKSVKPRLETLLRELEDDFNSNFDKIFMFFVEADEHSPEDSYFIIDILWYHFYLFDKENDYELEKIKSQGKKSSVAGIAGGALAGGLLSLIPVVGIPLAIGAGAMGGIISADTTNEKSKAAYDKYSNNVKEFIYNFTIIFTMWYVADGVVAMYENNVEEAGQDVIDTDDDNFFDEI